jgi:Peptidase family M28
MRSLNRERAGFLSMFLASAVMPQGPNWETLGKSWWSHIQVLADDELEGRGTATPGYQRAADYVTRQFRSLGLKPAGVKGYRQPVDFHVTQSDPDHCSLDIIRDGNVQPVKLGHEATIVVTSQTAEKGEGDAVFVGYGLAIPELNYNDFAGLNVKGKIVVFVRGGPSNIPGAIKAHYQSFEERLKVLRKAGVKGTAVIPNPTVPELPWPRMVSGLQLPRMELTDPGHDVPLPLPISILFNDEHAEMLFTGSGHTFQEIVSRLGSDQPLPRFPLAVKLHVRATFKRWEATCHNLVGVLPGSDPHLKNEYVVVSAHLDHLGIGEPVNGDPIYHGAMDNASGVASLLQVARGIKDSGMKPKRSILFLVVTGEEKGLLGSQYFATHPTVKGPIVADINIDGTLPLYALKFLQIQGLAESTLGDDLREVAGQHGVESHTEYEPDRVLFIRSDQYSFIKEGVPGLFPMFGYARGSAEEKMTKAWSKDRYHSPADNLSQPVDLVAAAQFNTILEKLTLRVANAEHRPEWKPDSFFRRFAQ